MKTDRVFDIGCEPLSSDHYDAGVDRFALLGSDVRGLAVYVHLPFCVSRCLTCDRITTTNSGTDTIDSYLALLNTEMQQVTRRIGTGRPVSQLHIGGGTPNSLSHAQLARVTDIVERHFTLPADASVSIDADPRRCTLTQLELLRGLGYSDIRFELRELTPSTDYNLGRACASELLADVVKNARDVGFERVHVDLVYGLPNQDAAALRTAVEALAAIGPDRVLCHPFTRREQDFPHQQLISIDSMPSLADKMTMFATIADAVQAAGYVWIGINGFVRPDDELVKAQTDGELFRGWLGYCKSSSPWLMGFGLGAMTELPGIVAQNTTVFDDWMARLMVGQAPDRTGVELSNDAASERDVFMRLGASLRVRIDEPEAADSRIFSALASDGLLETDGDTLKVTTTGRYVLNQYWQDSSLYQRWFKGCA